MVEFQQFLYSLLKKTYLFYSTFFHCKSCTSPFHSGKVDVAVPDGFWELLLLVNPHIEFVFVATPDQLQSREAIGMGITSFPSGIYITHAVKDSLAEYFL